MRSCGDEVSCEKVWRNLSRFFVHFLPRARSKAFLAYWRFQTENLHIAKDSLWVDAYTIKSLKLHPDILPKNAVALGDTWEITGRELDAVAEAPAGTTEGGVKLAFKAIREVDGRQPKSQSGS